MKISIKNEELLDVIGFLKGMTAKGKNSIARSRMLALVERKQKEFMEDRKVIIKNWAEKDEDGEAIVKADGTFSLTEKGNLKAGEEIMELLEENSVIEYGEHTSLLSKLEKYLDEYEVELSGNDAQGFFALVTAFENKEEK